METYMVDNLTRRRKGYIRTGIVKVLPVRRTGDWLPENADSAFMNTGAKVEYVVPRMRSGQLIDPLGDVKEEDRAVIAKQLGLKDYNELNINVEEKKNYWINKAVIIDRDGLYLNLANIADYITYKILEVNLEMIAPTWEERYNKGTYKFALVFEDEESKLKNVKIDTKKEAYMMFGKIDGSVKKLSDFMWIYYLTNKDGKRLPNNPSLDYLRAETGRIVEEKPGEFLSIVTDPLFETKALIQKAVNNGLIQRNGSFFTIFGEESSKNSLEGLIQYLLDERNNNIRISLIGRIEQVERGEVFPGVAELNKPVVETVNKEKEDENKSLLEKIDSIAKANEQLLKENEELKKQFAKSKKTDKTNKGTKTKKTE